MLAMRTLVNDVGTEMALFKDLAKVPNDQVATSVMTCISPAKLCASCKQAASHSWLPPMLLS